MWLLTATATAWLGVDTMVGVQFTNGCKTRSYTTRKEHDATRIAHATL